ncbi:MAG: hypothetical protein HQM09_04865 [Candidatus Riflebacteria bacterium]|nr:hypothetical protein [Candidatus Riflebacteria bacterium]
MDNPVLSKSEIESLLIERLKRRDETAFREVVIQYSGKIIRNARILLNSNEAAEDAAQEIFWKAYKNMHLIRGSKVSVWLFAITNNHCMDILRSGRSKKMEVSLPDEDILRDPTSPFPSGDWDFLNKLSALEHQVMTLRLVENLDYQEIADITGLARGTLRNIFSNCLKVAREEVVKHGL